MNSKLFFLFGSFLGLLVLESCSKDSLDNDEFISQRSSYKQAVTYNKKKEIFHYNITYQGKTAYCNRNIAGVFSSSERKFSRFEFLINNMSELKELMSEGSVWFIPNSVDRPTRVILGQSSNNVEPRTDGEITYCFCEHVGSDPIYGDNCDLIEGDCIPPPGANVCTDCDAEICIDTECLPYTRGGGIFILADTVILLQSNPSVIFGGRTKIELAESNDTLYFTREYIDDEEVFAQCYLNLTGTNIEGGFESDMWFIPFDKDFLARPGTDKECASDKDEECTGSCLLSLQDNGCYRCECQGGTGDCDFLEANGDDLIPPGILVRADVIVEQEP